MIIITPVTKASKLRCIYEAANFIEKECPRLARLVQYVYYSETPPVGWSCKLVKNPLVGGYARIDDTNGKERDIWLRPSSWWGVSELLGALAHELGHLYQARNITSDKFKRRYYKSKESHKKYEDRAYCLMRAARKRFDAKV